MEIPYHNTRPGYGVELNNDVWLLVLDHIVSISDLKTLCLTSKTLRSLATPRLYHTVCIPLWDKDKVRIFFESVGCGAGAHLGNTRALVFEDECPPEEPNCSLPGSLAFPRIDDPLKGLGWRQSVRRPRVVTDEDKDRAMTTVAHFFAKTKQLTTFRYISNRALPEAVSTNLVEPHRRNLKNLQCILARESRLFLFIRDKELSLRHLDLMMADENVVNYSVSMVVSSATTVESLSLGCLQTPEKPQLRMSVSMRLAGGLGYFAGSPSMLRLRQLNALKLQYLDLSSMQQSLSSLANMSSLSSLSIYNCQGTIRFFTELANDASVKPMELKHFALQMPDDSDEDVSATDIAAVKPYLDAIANSTTLKSLHVSWDGRSRMSGYLYSMRPRAPNLSSLSFHNRTNHPYDRDGGNNENFYQDEVWYDTLRDRLDGCPKLQAFGYKIPEYRVEYIVGNYNEVALDEPFMKLLQKASGLRVIHLRQRNYVPEDHFYGQVMMARINSGDAYAFCMQRWASAFFEYLHTRGWCSSLRALVIRCHVVDNKSYFEEGRGPTHYVPQCCYVKGFQTDMFGRTGVVAIPVTRARLRASEPWADILDYDPECG